jgi:hypothetical protein
MSKKKEEGRMETSDVLETSEVWLWQAAAEMGNARIRQSKTTRNNRKKGEKCAQGWRGMGGWGDFFRIWG